MTNSGCLITQELAVICLTITLIMKRMLMEQSHLLTSMGQHGTTMNQQGNGVAVIQPNAVATMDQITISAAATGIFTKFQMTLAPPITSMRRTSNSMTTFAITGTIMQAMKSITLIRALDLIQLLRSQVSRSTIFLEILQIYCMMSTGMHHTQEIMWEMRSSGLMTAHLSGNGLKTLATSR